MKRLFEKIYKGSQADLVCSLEDNLRENKKMFLVTANPEIFMAASNNEELENLLLDENTTIVADGIGIVKGAKTLGINLCKRIPGVEIVDSLFRLGNDQSKSIFILGARQAVLDKLCLQLKTKYPNLKILGAENGYIENKDAALEKIQPLCPDIVLVALGVPAQERLIYKHLPDFQRGIFIGVGGSLDVLSGSKRRAPRIFIRLNLEWLFRIITEPWRLKRFYNNNVRFLFELRKIKHR